MVGGTGLHKVGHTIAVMLVNQYVLPWKNDCEGKIDGGGCMRDKEIKAPHLLPCQSYAEFNNSGNNVMCILRRLMLPFFTTLMQKYTIKSITLFICLIPRSGVTSLASLVKSFSLFNATHVNTHFLYWIYYDLKQDCSPNIFTANSLF